MVSSLTMETWTKSSFCSKGECPEVLQEGKVVMFRESSSPDEILYMSPEAWDGFVKGVKAGEFDAR
jgi:hypothetical protein